MKIKTKAGELPEAAQEAAEAPTAPGESFFFWYARFSARPCAPFYNLFATGYHIPLNPARPNGKQNMTKPPAFHF